MSENKIRIRFLVLCLSFLLYFSFSFNQPVPLKIWGDYLPAVPIFKDNAEQLIYTPGENFTSHLLPWGVRVEMRNARDLTRGGCNC